MSSALAFQKKIWKTYVSIVEQRSSTQCGGFAGQVIEKRDIVVELIHQLFERVDATEYERALNTLPEDLRRDIRHLSFKTGCYHLVAGGERKVFRLNSGGCWYSHIVAEQLFEIIEAAEELLCLLAGADSSPTVEHVAETAARFGGAFGWLDGLLDRDAEVEREEEIYAQERGKRSEGAESTNEPYTADRRKWMEHVRQFEAEMGSRRKAIAEVSRRFGVGKSTLWGYFTIEKQIQRERSQGSHSA